MRKKLPLGPQEKFPLPIFTKLTNAKEQYLYNSYTKFHPSLQEVQNVQAEYIHSL
jgi:hypothetical protein